MYYTISMGEEQSLSAQEIVHQQFSAQREGIQEELQSSLSNADKEVQEKMLGEKLNPEPLDTAVLDMGEPAVWDQETGRPILRQGMKEILSDPGRKETLFRYIGVLQGDAVAAEVATQDDERAIEFALQAIDSMSPEQRQLFAELAEDEGIRNALTEYRAHGEKQDNSTHAESAQISEDNLAIAAVSAEGATATMNEATRVSTEAEQIVEQIPPSLSESLTGEHRTVLLADLTLVLANPPTDQEFPPLPSAYLIKEPRRWNPENNESTAALIQKIEAETGSEVVIQPETYRDIFRSRMGDSISKMIFSMRQTAGLSEEQHRKLRNMELAVRTWRVPEARIFPEPTRQYHAQVQEPVDIGADIETLDLLCKTVKNDDTFSNSAFYPEAVPGEIQRLRPIGFLNYLQATHSLLNQGDITGYVKSLLTAQFPDERSMPDYLKTLFAADRSLFKASPRDKGMFHNAQTTLYVYVQSPGNRGGGLPANTEAVQESGMFCPQLYIDATQGPRNGRYIPSIARTYKYDAPIQSPESLEIFLTSPADGTPRPHIWKQLSEIGHVQEPHAIYRSPSLL